MCGILGELSFNSKLSDKDSFLQLLNLSKDRGPDSEGYYTNNKNLQLGFNRLRVLDMTTMGDQPILSNKGRFIMIYNGEVYNYLDIREKLEFNGVKIESTGDAAVIVNAFEVFGVDKTVDMLDGMFSIGLYDNQNKKLSLIRDFAGIKPLYYGLNNDIIVFSSQYDQIAKHKTFCANQIDPEVLKLYLNQHFIPAPLGLLKNTYQVVLSLVTPNYIF